MRVLTVREPWAPLIAAGIKTVESRPNTITTYTGLVAIHCGQHRAVAGDAPRHVLDLAHLIGGGYVHHGHIVAVVDLVGSVRADHIRWVPADELPPGRRWTLTDGVATIDEAEQHLGDYSPSRAAWLLDDVVHLPAPIPARGRQGLRTLPTDIADQVRAQLHQPESTRP